METYQKITLENGVRILCEKIPYVRSVSAGIWVATGSRNEKNGECGAAHFIEHMLFKGTEERSASEIAALMDGIGGQTNAFTSKEHTCFYGRALDTHIDLLLDILFDMFFSSRFSEEDVVSERGVILEEIDMYEDTPEDLASERLFASIYKGNSLGRPILGTSSSLKKMTGVFLKEYMSSHYLAGDTVVALSGSFTDEHVKSISERFSQLKSGRGTAAKQAQYKPSFIVKRKSIEQNHLCLAFPACSLTDDKRYAYQLLCNILGGGMSSRLFQTLREKLGLCYSIYSFIASHNDTGILGIGTALSKETEIDAISAIKDEINRLCDSGVTPDEFSRAREQVKANILLGLESTSSRMHRLGKNELCLGYVPSSDDIINAYNAVTTDEILEVARSSFDYNLLSLSVVGRTSSADEYRELTNEQ